MTLDEWIATATAELGIDGLSVEEQRIVLDVAREVAHNVLRPAAPLSTFLLGVAVGRGGSLSGAATSLTEIAKRSGESVA